MDTSSQYQFTCQACGKDSSQPGYCHACAKELEDYLDWLNATQEISETKPNTMETPYITSLVQTLGFQSLKEAKASLGKSQLLEGLSEAYKSDNGAEGTVLWTEVVSAVNA